MARQAKTLTARGVMARRKPGYVAAGGTSGLYLQTSKTGTKSWVFRFKRNGRAREMGLGSLSKVSLALARERASEAWLKLDQGIDPIEERRDNRTTRALEARKRHWTFAQCCDAYIKAKRSGWKTDKHAQQWANTLAIHAYPHMSLTEPEEGEPWPGDMPVNAITREHVMAALEPIWTTKTETAVMLRSRIELVLNFATASGHRPEGVNPARWKGGLDAVLPKPNKVRTKVHHAALPYADMPAFMARLRAVEGMPARALEFIVYTAARSGEVRLATWDEVDMAAKVWRVPAERTKMGRAHEVPLSDPALMLLKSLPRFAETNLVFPSAKGKPLPDEMVSRVTRVALNVDAVPHGMRSTFRDWCGNETSYPRELAEHALGHAVGDQSEQAYRRGAATERRRPLIQDWASYISRPATRATVTTLKGRKGRA